MEGLGVYKYLQIFLVLVDIMELEDVWVFNKLQDGDLPFHLGNRVVTEEQRSAWPLSLPHSHRVLLPLKHTHTPSSAPIQTASPGLQS